MILWVIRKIQLIIALTSTTLYCLLYGHEEDRTKCIQFLRYLFSFFLGFLLGYLLWLLLSINCDCSFLDEQLMVKVSFFTTFLLIIALFYTISRNARAVILLIFVTFGDKAGQRYLRAAILGLVISGPIDNLVLNAAEVARAFACSTNLTYNVTKTQLDLMAKPFTNTLNTMKGDIDEIQSSFRNLENILNELKYGLEGEEKIDIEKYRKATNISLNTKIPKASEIQEKFVHKMQQRCKLQLNAGHHVCQEVFSQGFRKCATNFPSLMANAICWPYRIDIICKVNMFGNPDKVCDASKVIPADFGKTYISFLKTKQKLFDNSSNIAITYKVKNTSRAEQLRSAQMIFNEFMDDFERRRQIFKTVTTIIEKLLCFVFIYVVCKAMKYLWNYRNQIEFDNFYITDYFKHLDERRKSSLQRSVLPMRRLEMSRTVDLDEICSHTVTESRLELYHLIQMSLEMLTAVIFIFLDLMVVNLLHIINHRSLISYQQQGEHAVLFRINGTGLMARLLRTTMKNFNIHERISTSLSNEECLPLVHWLPNSFYIKVILIYLIIIMLINYGIFILRLRRMICGYFFYKREKQRILFLYGTMLRNHASYLKEVRQIAEMNMSTRHILGKMHIFLFLRLSFPKYFGWLRKFKCAKCHCLICSAAENNKFIICSKCKFPYCRACSREMNWICVFCEQSMPHDPNTVDSKVSDVDLYTYRNRPTG